MIKGIYIFSNRRQYLNKMSYESVNFESVDTVYRSRITLLDILEERGYNVEPFKKFSPVEITLALENIEGLDLEIQHKDDEERKCIVTYHKISRQSLSAKNREKTLEFFKERVTNPEKTEIYVLQFEPVVEVHHEFSYRQWNENKYKIYFFCMPYIVVNPLRHEFVPKHEILPKEQHAELMAKLYMTSKTQFPIIRYHIDPITRCIGASPGDIIKITRASPSAGEYIVYRVCLP